MTPWVLRLIAANVFIFFLQGAMGPRLFASLVLIPMDLPLRPWTILTYQFLHGGFLHLAFNMLALYFFGPRLEARLGGTRFLTLYLLSGVAGAALSFLTPTSAIIGASGAVFGVLLGFARYYPRERIYIWAIIPVEARILVIFLALFSVWAGFSGQGGNVAHFAHLGGFVGGWLYLRYVERNTAAARFRRQVETAQVSARPDGSELRRWRDVGRDSMHPLNREEFDRILAKAEALGVGSLTIPERAFMERVSGSNG
jgi:membrane associated rhomboid family serine protease